MRGRRENGEGEEGERRGGGGRKVRRRRERGRKEKRVESTAQTFSVGRVSSSLSSAAAREKGRCLTLVAPLTISYSPPCRSSCCLKTSCSS